MKNMKLQKYLTAASLIIGGLITIYAFAIHPKEFTDLETMRQTVDASAKSHLFLYFGVIILLMGLPGLYTRVCNSTGIVALLSMPPLFIGTALLLTHCPLSFAALPAIVNAAPEKAIAIVEAASETPYGILEPIGTPLMILGLLLFLIGTWRQKETAKYPRYLLLASLVCIPLALAKIPFVGRGFTFGVFVAFVAYGVEILRRPGEAKESRAANLTAAVTAS